MEHLHVPYSTWKQVALTNSFTPYHIVVVSGQVVTAVCGTADIQFECNIDVDDYDDWSTVFASSEICESVDDARAKVIGLYVEPPTPRESDA